MPTIKKGAASGIMLTLLLIGMLAFSLQPAQSIITPTLSAWAFVTPTIDGVLSLGEWDDDAVETFTLSTPEEHYCILYVKNDEQNLYFALIIKDEEFNPFPPEGGPCDYVSIEFDNDHDGVRWEVGDNCLFLRGDGGLIYDGFFRPDGGWGPDGTYNGTNDIVGAVSHTNQAEIGDYIFECLHPLNTADDTHDFSLSFGDIVGFRINYCDGASPGGYHSFWPETSCADIIVAKPRIIVPDDYPTIQEAINYANEGDTVYVKSGIYYEQVIVNKTISLVGENENTTIINGCGNGNLVTVEEAYTTVTGFTVRNASIGFYILGFNHTIIGNIVSNNTHHGIDVVGRNNCISENTITNNRYGIILSASSYNIMCQNTLMNNQGGINLCEDCKDNDISKNTFIDNTMGIGLAGNNNSVVENTIKENWCGIEISGTNNTICHNDFINNINQVCLDNFFGNAWDDGYPSGGNYWSDYVGVDVKNGPGQDLPGSDGIGDMPYVIDADNVDHYPLMNPYGAPSLPTYSLTINITVWGTTDPAPGTYSYTLNSTVQVTAIPEVNYLFDHWELDDTNVGSANPYTVTMNRDHTLKAVFSPVLGVPVGGYSFPIKVHAKAELITPYITLITILTIIFIKVKQKEKAKDLSA